MKKTISLLALFLAFLMNAQTNPAITKWLQNTTTTGTYYVSGNSTPISNGILVNCQQVRYSTNWIYVNATGIPAYPTGIFSGDGNPNVAGNQNAIYKFPLNPTQNTGTPTATNAGNCGVFINGVSLFDYRDGVAWNNTTSTLCGGPGNSTCPGGMGATQAWNRDAVPAEKLGFDCAKGHPAGTNYHHHQNPSAFKYDSTTSNTYSSICNLYDSEGLYTINTSTHSPLIGFAYDGFPIYGAYAYTNVNGTGAIARMKSSYQLKNQTTRTNGPTVNQVVGTQTFFNGYFKEDYEYIAHPTDPTYLDEHNGRFCITPEYPNGIYCYFATVNADNSSAYPYVIGPTYYGNKTGAKVTSVTESTTTYVLANENFVLNSASITVFPNPASDFFTVQTDFVENELKVELINELGQIVKESKILQGTTFCIIETDTIYNGMYFVKISDGKNSKSIKVIINK
ncbi:YHYH protein [uncultured Flavobacterium sp.]|uniref:YHYH protein n=1 Tax=uncultured Flavobacterium sp. TaxID=165435 RepID=UPI0030EE548D|tara:strand:+ start:98416 stop:99774 length:1359 start_codon:yes stop_codon:yes gene_type:complete